MSDRSSGRCAGRRLAVTMIELLIVVALIGILVAILLPSLAKARASARLVTCQANLRELHRGWQLYLDESHGRFLQGVNWHINYGGRQGLGDPAYGKDPDRPVAKPLNKHLTLPTVTYDSADVFRCPADSGNKRIDEHFVHYGTSYLANPLLVGQDELFVNPNDPIHDLMVKVSGRRKNISESTKFPKELLLLGDFGWYKAWRFGWPPKYQFDWHGRPSHHNLAYVDGHVAFVRIQQGVSVTSDYCVLPFRDLAAAAAERRHAVP